MITHPPLSVDYIQSRLRVNLSTGICHWKDATKHHRPLVGKEAGFSQQTHGGKLYWMIKIDGIPYKRAKIVYAVKTGRWPESILDHKNGLSLDDRPSNLRPATRMQNARNRKIGVKGRALPMGVRHANSKFQARINVDKKQVNLGVFNSIDAARVAYLCARRKYFGEFA